MAKFRIVHMGKNINKVDVWGLEEATGRPKDPWRLVRDAVDKAGLVALMRQIIQDRKAAAVEAERIKPVYFNDEGVEVAE